MPPPKTWDDSAISITVPNPKLPQPRKLLAMKLDFGSPPGYIPIAPDINDVKNQVEGLQQRLGREIPEPEPALLAEFELFVQNYLKENVRKLERIMTFKEWLASTSYNDKRKADLTRTFEEIENPSCLNRKLRRKIASFIKRECYGQFKYPRWINSRSDAFKCCSGPFFKSIEEEVYKIRAFIKHVPVADRRRVIGELRRNGRQYFSTDYTAFESHFTTKFMQICELALYRHMGSHLDAELVEMICSTLGGSNHGRTRSGVGFKVKGRRMSGDMCTSLGNGFANLMLWNFITSKLGISTDGYVEGDDGIFATWGARVDADQISKFAQRLGFTIKVIEHEDPRTAGFCGMIFADDAIIKDPRSVLEGLGWSFSFIGASNKVKTQLLRAKMMSLACELPQCPILGAIARRGIKDTQGASPRFVYDGYHNKLPSDFVAPEFCVTDTTRDLFSELFGISPAVQEQLESRILDGTDPALEYLGTVLPPSRDMLKMSSYYAT